MISSTLGAPLGGTMFGGQPGVESAAVRLILPANGGGGFGMYFPSMVVVALGEPGVPVVWTCALAEGVAIITVAAHIPLRKMECCGFMVVSFRGLSSRLFAAPVRCRSAATSSPALRPRPAHPGAPWQAMQPFEETSSSVSPHSRQ